MAFEPYNKDHAIVEVGLALVSLTHFTSDDRASVKAAHPQWEALLPGLQDQGVINIGFAAPGTDLPPPPISPLAFTRHRADGQIEWRLSMESDAVIVNCRSYTSWQDVWRVAKGLFTDVVCVLHSQQQRVESVILQYLDVFRWTGDGLYDARHLLQDGDFVAPAIFNRGATWHLHQGWFEDVQKPVSGRVLRRMDIGSTQEEHEHPEVRFDARHRFDLRDAPTFHGMFTEQDSLADSLFDYLHSASKDLLASFLTANMAQRIRLNDD